VVLVKVQRSLPIFKVGLCRERIDTWLAEKKKEKKRKNRKIFNRFFFLLFGEMWDWVYGER
jgi:hypothetical protein